MSNVGTPSQYPAMKAHITEYHTPYCNVYKSGEAPGRVPVLVDLVRYAQEPDNNWWVDENDREKAILEGSVVLHSKANNKFFGAFSYNPNTEKWKPASCAYGSGNRGNPLHMGICAADQAVHPFGSRVMVIDPLLPDRFPHQTFYVGDVGNAIKGPYRFDLWAKDPGEKMAGRVNGGYRVVVIPPAFKCTILNHQRALKVLGHYEGKIDGLWGTKSRTASANWSIAHVGEIDSGAYKPSISEMCMPMAAQNMHLVMEDCLKKLEKAKKERIETGGNVPPLIYAKD